ncbi:MAG: DNA repair protein RadA, partial [Myxococcota bacterium]
MARTQTLYHCNSCGHAEKKWLGRCPSCQSWNSFVEELAPRAAASARARGRPQGPRAAARAVPLTEVAGEA